MKLGISNKVRVPLKFKMQDGANVRQFNFTLECDRLSTDEFQKRNQDDNGVVSNEKIKENMLGITTGWSGQQLVLDDDGQPAAFSQEALEFMFGVAGVLDVAVTSYMKESTATVKN
jgi:hypothetical protein